MPMCIICRQESSEETELRAALAASITDTHFKPVCYDLSDSNNDGNDSDDISEAPDSDEEPAADSSGNGSGAVVPDSDSCTKTTTTAAVLHDDDGSINSDDNCIGGSPHDVDAVAELPELSHGRDRLVPTEEEKPLSWKDYLGPESGKWHFLCAY